MSLGSVVTNLRSILEGISVTPAFQGVQRYDVKGIPKNLRDFSVVPIGQSRASKHLGEVLWRDEFRRYLITIAYPTGYQSEDLAVIVEDDEARIVYALVDRDNWTASEIISLAKVDSSLDTKDPKIWYHGITVEAGVHYGRPS